MFKISSFGRINAFAFAVALLLAGCVRNAIPTAIGVPSNPFPSERSEAHRAAQTSAVIYASNGAVAVDEFSVPGYAKIGSITNVVAAPAGLWVDKAGRLYIANSSGQNVTEYAPGTSSPMCTYTVPDGRPDFVTTDSQGHVYVTAFISTYGSASSWIYGYSQCGKLIKSYSWLHYGQFVERVGGVAVDANGNVFVRFSNGLEEFKSGRFTPTSLPATWPGLASALILDAHNNLIATDDVRSVYVIPPPYTAAHVLVSGLYYPRGLSLNASENRLFVVDYTQQTVKIYQHPSGGIGPVMRPVISVAG